MKVSAQIQSLAWVLPYATGAALKKREKMSECITRDMKVIFILGQRQKSLKNFLAAPTTCGSSQEKDGDKVTAVTTPDP